MMIAYYLLGFPSQIEFLALVTTGGTVCGARGDKEGVGGCTTLGLEGSSTDFWLFQRVRDTNNFFFTFSDILKF